MLSQGTQHIAQAESMGRRKGYILFGVGWNFQEEQRASPFVGLEKKIGIQILSSVWAPKKKKNEAPCEGGKKKAAKKKKRAGRSRKQEGTAQGDMATVVRTSNRLTFPKNKGGVTDEVPQRGGVKR